MTRSIRFVPMWLSPSVRLALGGGALVAALLLSGCAGPATPGGEPPAETVAEVVAAVDCQAPNLGQPMIVHPSVAPPTTDAPPRPDAPAAGDMPAGFAPVTLYRCTFLDTYDDEQGRWSAVTVETLAGDLSRLVTALAEPDDEPGFNQVCSADMELVPVLWLENAHGKAIRVAWPATACGKTKAATHEVVDSFAVTSTTTLPLTLIASREAIDADCTMQASIPLWGGLQNMAGAPLPNDDVTSESAEHGPAADGLCLYTVDPGAGELKPIPGADAQLQQQLQDSTLLIVSGSFAGAAPLPAATIALIEAAASGAGAPAADCDTLVTRFAQFGSGSIVSPITVELDGCERLYASTGLAYETPAPLSAALAGL